MNTRKSCIEFLKNLGITVDEKTTEFRLVKSRGNTSFEIIVPTSADVVKEAFKTNGLTKIRANYVDGRVKTAGTRYFAVAGTNHTAAVIKNKKAGRSGYGFCTIGLYNFDRTQMAL